MGTVDLIRNFASRIFKAGYGPDGCDAKFPRTPIRDNTTKSETDLRAFKHFFALTASEITIHLRSPSLRVHWHWLCL